MPRTGCPALERNHHPRILILDTPLWPHPSCTVQSTVSEESTKAPRWSICSAASIHMTVHADLPAAPPLPDAYWFVLPSIVRIARSGLAPPCTTSPGAGRTGFSPWPHTVQRPADDPFMNVHIAHAHSDILGLHAGRYN